MAAVTLIDADRQWFKARRGLGVPKRRAAMAFCHYTIAAADGLAVEDAEADPRFAGTPLVTGDPHIRSYLGAPLRTPDGYQVGALCVISDKVRRFPPSIARSCGVFPQVVVSQMELRQLASRDSLTGALTRRAFDQAVFDALEAAGPRRPAPSRCSISIISSRSTTSMAMAVAMPCSSRSAAALRGGAGPPACHRPAGR